MVELVLEIVCLLAALFVKDSLALTSATSRCNTNLKVCTTPDGAEGDCINIKECPAFVKILRDPRRTEEETRFLQESECSKRIGKDVFTCCRYQRNNLLPDTEDCGQSFDNRIVGGSATHINEYPWVAMIGFIYPDNTTRYKCGGNLINSRYVLTAAHCMWATGLIHAYLSNVRLGEWNTNTDPDCEVNRNGVNVCADPHLDVDIATYYLHPSYRPNAKNEGVFHLNDIALIRLDRDVIFSDFIQPICLPVRPYQRSKTFDGVEMQVSGWGLTETNVSSIVKRKLTITGVEFESCRATYLRKGRQLGGYQMCAGGEWGKDACKTDSGGPLMARQCVDSRNALVLVGIVSFGHFPCGVLDFPAVYTRVGPYMEWIESLLQP